MMCGPLNTIGTLARDWLARRFGLSLAQRLARGIWVLSSYMARSLLMAKLLPFCGSLLSEGSLLMDGSLSNLALFLKPLYSFRRQIQIGICVVSTVRMPPCENQRGRSAVDSAFSSDAPQISAGGARYAPPLGFADERFVHLVGRSVDRRIDLVRVAEDAERVRFGRIGFVVEPIRLLVPMR